LTPQSKLATAASHECVWVDVPEPALTAYEAALKATCDSVGTFMGAGCSWRVEGVKPIGERNGELAAALALAATLSSHAATLERASIEPSDWIARTRSAFPEQLIGKRFAIRGTHDTSPRRLGRINLTLDAGLAFGSGEHASTRGCLIALERVARHRARKILDLGTGSGILAMAAAGVLHRPVLAADIDQRAVLVTRENARLNRLPHLVQCRVANGWHTAFLRQSGPYDLVFANILARPLAAMARDLATHLAPGGAAILSGLLRREARFVLFAHRRRGLYLAATIRQGEWVTLVVRKP
jgi:ribosomal protein L11 methyltransferase